MQPDTEFRAKPRLSLIAKMAAVLGGLALAVGPLCALESTGPTLAVAAIAAPTLVHCSGASAERAGNIAKEAAIDLATCTAQAVAADLPQLVLDGLTGGNWQGDLLHLVTARGLPAVACTVDKVMHGEVLTSSGDASPIGNASGIEGRPMMLRAGMYPPPPDPGVQRARLARERAKQWIQEQHKAGKVKARPGDA
jgi:hypothetical protein